MKAHLEPEIYDQIDLKSLVLTEKSFIVPQLREIHSDIIYKCLIKNTQGYINFLFEHQSTPDPLMAFRILHFTVSLGHEHILQGHSKLPIVLPFCIYHGEASPYPYSISIYNCYPDPEFAKKAALKPFRLIDLTVLSDEEISKHGLAALMEMLFKHQRDKDFLSIMRKMLQSRLVQNVIKELNISYLNDMSNYIVTTTQDETEPKAAQHLIQDLIRAFPDETARKSIMTFAQQLKEDYKQEFMRTIAPQLKQEGLYEVAKNLLAEGMPLELVRKVTKLSDLDLTELEKA